MQKRQESYGKEEIRGLFVLGIMALLIALRYDQTLTAGNWGMEKRFLIDALLVGWSIYAFFIVVALSGDFFGQWVSRGARFGAQFALGCSLVYTLSFALLWVLWLMVPPAWVTWGLLDSKLNIDIGLNWSAFAAIPAIIIPPVYGSARLSPTYGKKVWLLCPLVIVLMAMAFIAYPHSFDIEITHLK